MELVHRPAADADPLANLVARIAGVSGCLFRQYCRNRFSRLSDLPLFRFLAFILAPHLAELQFLADRQMSSHDVRVAGHQPRVGAPAGMTGRAAMESGRGMPRGASDISTLPLSHPNRIVNDVTGNPFSTTTLLPLFLKTDEKLREMMNGLEKQLSRDKLAFRRGFTMKCRLFSGAS